MKIKLPFWMDNGEVKKIAQLFEKWWTYILEFIRCPFELLDEEKCSEKVLYLIAYQRNITRFLNEPLPLFRKRVKYAFINAKDAGSKAGFIRIFERLGIGYVELVERFDLENWDVIKVQVTDNQIAKNPDLLQFIIREYGRTCRRYTFEIIINQKVHLIHGEFNNDYRTYPVKLTI
ncbi:phage tail protein [Pasteurella skyensis]|uniref:Phage tail protein n=1 Tax=Phocoenobacter skyensis TaxID=97481 RepID=A0AAJ6P1J1_9PAST|nr:phage tail protein [Pasteurella skyensis]MDP8173688.1 phage tail protein [Pasteurella skyensis]MDP8178056.1 phage tail protein [Pasteurella skyensis]